VVTDPVFIRFINPVGFSSYTVSNSTTAEDVSYLLPALRRCLHCLDTWRAPVNEPVIPGCLGTKLQ